MQGSKRGPNAVEYVPASQAERDTLDARRRIKAKFKGKKKLTRNELDELVLELSRAHGLIEGGPNETS